jgi:glucan phosphoethanolaminetransferase (alkaline phosphatase superfamily)
MLALDALIWFSAPTVFLYFYINAPGVSAEVIGPHLWLALIALYLASVARIGIAFAVRSDRLRLFVSALFIAAFPITTLFYYPLVIFGLSSWGQVVSWNLIKSYFRQAPQVFDALDLSLPLTALGLLLVIALVFLLVWMYLCRFDWPRLLKQAPPKKSTAMLLIGGVLGSALALHNVFELRAGSADPIVSTFFPKQGVHAVAGFVVNDQTVVQLDRDADNARKSYRPNPNAMRRNLILIVVDALRPDHLEAYGYQRKTTPSLTKIMASVPSRTIDSVRATCGESACGLFSISSARYAHEVSSRAFTIQQALKLHGYQVHMIMGGDHQNFYGLRALYGDVDSFIDGSSSGGVYMNSDQWVLKSAAELPVWSGVPIMIQFHLMSAHPLGSREPFMLKFKPALQYSLPLNKAARTTETMVNYYDNGVVQADFNIGTLIDTLQSKSYLKDALVVITADHGEALGEHGLVSHSNGVHDSVIKVPFIVLSYGRSPITIAPKRLAPSQTDIAPTILQDFGMPLPATWRGTPVQLPLVEPVSYFQQSDEVGVIDHRHYPDVWKYWINVRTREEYAFNLRTDPSELHNLVRSAPKEWLRDWRIWARNTRPAALTH